MAKLMVRAALFLALLASANAVTFQMTITNTADEEEVNPGRNSEKCKEQVQAMQLRECMMSISRGSPYDLRLRMVVNPHEQMLQQCCMKLENVPEQCRCKVIKEMMMTMKQEGQGQQSEHQMKQMTQKVKYLPKMCNMQPPCFPILS